MADAKQKITYRCNICWAAPATRVGRCWCVACDACADRANACCGKPADFEERLASPKMKPLLDGSKALHKQAVAVQEFEMRQAQRYILGFF